jgi:hypothetical protein
MLECFTSKRNVSFHFPQIENCLVNINHKQPGSHLPLIFTYCISGLTHTARLLGRVQGVVVQATKDIFSSSSNGKVTNTEGS